MDQLLSRASVVHWLGGWAKWKLASGVALGYPSMVSFMRMFGGENSSYNYDEVDSWCIKMDEAVELLPIVQKEMIRMEYLSVYKTVAVKAHRMGISKRAYHQYLNTSYESLGNILQTRLRTVHDSDTFLLNQLEMRQQGAN